MLIILKQGFSIKRREESISDLKAGLSKRAWVTGASEGIGRAFAKKLAKRGYAVTGIARNEPRLKSLLNELQAISPHLQHEIKVLDLSNPNEIESLARQLNGVQLLVNNAGRGLYGDFDQVDWKELESLLFLNVFSLLRLSHAFIKQAQFGDALINVSSTLAFLPLPQAALYAASKSLVSSFSDALWVEQKEKGIFVLDLCPGSTESNFHSRAGGIKPPVPKIFIQTPEQVAQKALKELDRRTNPLVISGFHNQLSSLLARLLPRKWLVQIVGKFGGLPKTPHA